MGWIVRIKFTSMITRRSSISANYGLVSTPQLADLF